MTEFEIQFDPHCAECGQDLDADVDLKRDEVSLKISPCPNCIKKAESEAASEARAEGYEDGFDKGKEEGLKEGAPES